MSQCADTAVWYRAVDLALGTTATFLSKDRSFVRDAF